MLGKSPYDEIDSMQRWSTVSQSVAAGTYDPQGRVRFTIAADAAVASAGSCFAARIAEGLRANHARYLVTEPAPLWMTADQIHEYGFLPFSARYGLVFTTLQLFQLIERAFDRFAPIESAWNLGDRFVDPFRPRIVRDGFESIDELEADRRTHLAAVRRLFETLDVFIFTLGLTEVWVDRRDGAAYPIAPGVAGGAYDPDIHEVRNLGVAATANYLERFLDALRVVNPTARVVLTVSPVPIGATTEPQHAARASVYTKSVLRVVAEETMRAHENVDYFAGYEMVSQSFAGDDPFLEDRRHLKDAAVERVLDKFFEHYLGGKRHPPAAAARETPALDVRVCDEDVFAT